MKSATLIESTELLLIFLIPVFLLAHCYFLSCYFFSYFPTVSFFPVILFILLPKWTITFFPVSFFPICPLLLSFLLLFFLLAHCFFFPVTFFPTWNCYFLSCYLFSCYFLSVHPFRHPRWWPLKRLRDPPTWLKGYATLEKPQPPLTVGVKYDKVNTYISHKFWVQTAGRLNQTIYDGTKQHCFMMSSKRSNDEIHCFPIVQPLSHNTEII